MTEEEAKTKFCVHSNAAESLTKCDGSSCMAWRWETSVETDRDDRGYVSETYKVASDEHGYCGLAGRP